MKFSTKLRNFLDKNNMTNCYFASLVGISGSMMNKYLFHNSLPSYKIAKRINIATVNIITMKNMGYA